MAVAEAERVLGAAGVAHRRIDWLVGAPDRVDAAWDVSHTVFMELVGDVVGGPGPAAVVPFESLRDAMREDWRGWVPDADDAELDRIVDRRLATAAACDLTWHAVLVDGEPVTWCDLRLLEVDGALVGQLDELLTLPEHRGHGYGRAALTHATLTAVAAGATSVFMEADRDDWPRDLYSRMGFVARGTGDHRGRAGGDVSSWDDWRQARLDRLRGPWSPLALTGTHWFDDELTLDGVPGRWVATGRRRHADRAGG